MKILIKNGRVLNPATGTDEMLDVLVEDGIVKKMEKQIREEAERIIDAKGCYVMPGFIDLHVHLRDPGLTHKETIETGCLAAAHGGFTTILAMPNTKPVADCPEVIRYVHEKAKELGIVNVLQVGAVTKGQAGAELSNIEGMIKAGCPAISEDGKSVMNSRLYREAMKIAAKYDIPVLAHCEEALPSCHLPPLLPFLPLRIRQAVYFRSRSEAGLRDALSALSYQEFLYLLPVNDEVYFFFESSPAGAALPPLSIISAFLATLTYSLCRSKAQRWKSMRWRGKSSTSLPVRSQ